MEVDIKRVGHDAEGIAYLNRKPIFIYYAYKGEIVDINLRTNVRGAYEGDIVKMVKPSPYRIEPLCPFYGTCGGCNLMHINYSEALSYKKDTIQFLVNTRLKDIKNIKINDTIGSNDVFNYRNKIDIPVKYSKGKNVMGLFHRGSIKFLKIDKCIVQEEALNKVATTILHLMTKHKINAYNNGTKEGYITHLSIRVNLEGQMQLAFVTKRKVNLDNLIKELVQLEPNLISIYESYVYDLKSNRDIFDGQMKLLYGHENLVMTLNNFQFLLTPNSFFQLNTMQAIRLYEMIVEKANFKKTDTVLDAYCGVGTIASFISPHVKNVVAIEFVKAAVKAMDESLLINNITNVRTITGDVIKASSRIKEEFDVMVFDPPRVGLGDVMVKYILKSKPRKVVYVSCNPETLVEDLLGLSKLYNILEITPFDMFPQTSQIESITILELK